VQRYKFQALVTLGSPQDGGPAAMPRGEMHRLVVRGRNHDTGGSKFFSALVMRNGEDARWADNDPVIMTIVLVGDHPRQYFEVGDQFAFWLGHDLGRGIVTRRLFV